MAARGPSSGAGYWQSSANTAKRIKAAGSAEDVSFLDDPFGDNIPTTAYDDTDVRVTGASVGPKPRASFEGGGHGNTPHSTRCYSCMWRNPQARKHKTWEGDGILIVRGMRATLKDSDSGKDIGSGAVGSSNIASGDQFTIGGKEIEIDESVDPSSVFSGIAFMKPLEPAHPPPPTIMRSAPAFSLKAKVNTPVSKYEPSFFGTKPTSVGPSTLRGPPTGNDSPMLRAPVRPPKQGVPKHDPTAPGAIVMERPDDVHQKRYNKKALPLVDVVIDPHIGKRLREHQTAGVKFLYECVTGMRGEGQGAILADEMGLGKTIQAIALSWTLLKQNPYQGSSSIVDRVLVVCPVTLVKNWAREFRKWLGQDRIGVFAADSKADVKMFCANKNNQVLIIGYEKLRTVAEDIRKAQPPIGLVICDEGHRLKSAGTKTVQALRLFNTPRRVILSGTPIQNDLSEFHAMADYVNPNALDSYQTFKKMYEMPILRSRDPNSTKQNKDLGKTRSDQLTRLAKQFVLRRTSEVIAGFLPPKHEHVVFIAPTELQLAIYSQILDSPNTRDLFSGAGTQHLVLISTLKKLCNTPGLLQKMVKEGKGGKIFGLDEVKSLFPSSMDVNDVALSGKLLALMSYLKSLKEHTDEKVILVSNYTQTLDIIEVLLRLVPYTFCRLDGSTQQAKRQDIVDSFNRTSQDKQFVFLLSSKSGGTGLNLIGASRLILFDSDWNPSTDLQAMARIHRDGQKRACHIYRFLTAGTMDEKIFQRQVTKTGLAGSLMEENGASGNTGSDAFTLDELRSIFTLHPSTRSQTHELLGCRCAGSHANVDGSDDAMDEDHDDDDDEAMPSPTFVSAAKAKVDPVKMARDRVKLAALRDWRHVDCTVPQALADIDDVPLRALISATLPSTGSTAGKKRKKSKSKSKSKSRAVVSDDEEDDEAEGEATAGDDDDNDQEERTKLQGGQVTFLFSRSITAPLEDEAEGEGDEEA